MGSPMTDFSDEQLGVLADRVADRLSERRLLSISSPDGPPVVQLPPEFYALQRESAERLARLEERVDQGFSAMELRFEAIDKRFEATEKRFEAMDKRFEAIDKRFEAIDKRFEDLYHYLDKRFEVVEKRFEANDRRFEQLDRRFNGVVGLISLSTVIVGGLVVLFQVL